MAPPAPTDPALWRRLEALLPDALDRPDAERAAFLDAACVTPDGRPDAALRAEAGHLLACLADADASGALISPFDGLGWVAAYAPDGAPTGSLLPERVGAWRITGLLGRGGMGVVYAAERAEATFTQRAALKLVRPEVGEEFRARFVHERAVLAGLEHDHIARLLDGGVAPDGAPFLAMERVDGVPITDWAGAADLDVAARLRLFLQVCEAVAYAHRNLVVHRDLKPSNVLVTEAGRAKLLDFGVAKLLDAETDADETRTHAALTPAYAAPEQLRRERVTTATDVYALGVMLYELLAGVRPYALSGTTAAEAERLVCETVPPLPSAVAPADRARALRGDLDTVVMKALAKEPARRYASAEAFATDVERHLSGLPVAARRATRWYRASRFVRRHRLGVTAAAVVALAVLGGAGAALWQARLAGQASDRAEARFEIAHEAARALVYDVHDDVAALDGSTATRARILERAVGYLDRLAADPTAGRGLRVDLAEAYFKVGQVQGGPNAPGLGRSHSAAESFRRGLGVLPPPATPAAADTTGRSAERIRGRLHEKLGGVLAGQGRLALALRHLGDALAAFDRALAHAPADAETRVLRAGGLVNQADYTGHPDFPNDGRPADALAGYRAARAALTALPPDARTLYAERLLGITWERESTVQAAAGDRQAALASARRALALRLVLAARPDADYETRRDAAVAHEKMGLLLSQQGRPAAALAALRRAHAGYTALAAADTANAGARRTLAISHLHMADLLGARTPPRVAEARREADRALALLRPLAARDTADVALRDLLALVRARRAAL